VNQVVDIIKQLKDEGMSADDLLATFVSRRVCLLQHRPHKMCFMSSRHDPCRITTFELSKPEVYRWVKPIGKTDLAEDDWEWGEITPRRRRSRA
jgi:hypothetical protein